MLPPMLVGAHRSAMQQGGQSDLSAEAHLPAKAEACRPPNWHRSASHFARALGPTAILGSNTHYRSAGVARPRFCLRGLFGYRVMADTSRAAISATVRVRQPRTGLAMADTRT